jgi:protein-S-isoprenylcysteine O-methyltransferase Ste14
MNGGREMKQERIAVLAFVFAALITMGIALLSPCKIQLLRGTGKILGEVIFLLGMALFFWAVIYLRESFQGKVAPVSDRLVTTGPYRWARHPLYLSMIITLVAIAVALRSVWGFLSVFALFVPATVFRARLEENALSEKFGREWIEYTNQTKFLFPSLL